MSSCFFAGCTFFVFRTEENEGEPCEKCFILILSFAVSFSNRCVMVFKGEEKHVLAAHDGDDVVAIDTSRTFVYGYALWK